MRSRIRVPPHARLLLGVVLVAAIAGLHMLRFTVVVDDAFISFRAAENWARLGVPEYNPGSREWVPTPFLWVALLALGHAITRLPSPTVAQMLGGAAGLATVILPLFLLPASRRAAFLGALACATASAWAAWPLSGMETSFFALLVSMHTLLWLRYIGAPRPRTALAAGLAGGLAVATRLDGVWLLAAGLVALAVVRRPRDGIFFGTGFLATSLPALVYLYAVFGTVVPVSFHAKIHGLANLEHGIAHLLGFAHQVHLQLLGPILLLPLLASARRRATLVLLAALSAAAAWTVVTGGDFMPYYRFLHPAWPLAALAFGLGLVAAEERLAAWRPALRPAWRWVSLLVALSAAGSLSGPSFRGAERRRYVESGAEERTRAAVGRWFAGRYPASEWMAVKPAGIIPYHAGLHAIDFFCLVDGEAARTGEWVPGGWIGHQRLNAVRIHALGPKIVVLEARLHPLDRLPPPGATDPNHGKSWLVHPDAARYRPFRAEVLPGLWLNYFERP